MSSKHNSSGFFTRLRERVYPFFWFLAAADESLLMRCPAPEKDKHAGIGLAILCTSVAAVISSYYAFFSLSQQILISLMIALFWGIIILNLDRFMVGSIRKPKDRNIPKEMLVALPRILLACLIALVISKPLEIKIFHNQIEEAKSNFRDSLMSSKFSFENNLLKQQEKRREDIKDGVDRLVAESKNFSLDADYQKYKRAYDACTDEAAAIEKKLVNQRELRRKALANDNEAKAIQAQKNISSLLRRKNELDCAGKKRQMDDRASEYSQGLLKKVAQQNDLIQKIDTGITEISDDQDSGRIKAHAAFFNATDKDILGQLRILSSLKEKDSAMWWTGVLITSIFFLLELAPLFVKIISPRGEYDTLIGISEREALDNEEAAEAESSQQKTARIKFAAKTSQQTDGLDDEIQLRVQEKILAAQANLAEKIVDIWEKEEEKMLEADPAGYLKNKITKMT